MLIVTLHNDSTAKNGYGNYDVTVRVNQTILWTGRVEGHRRSTGWLALLRAMMKVIQR